MQNKPHYRILIALISLLIALGLLFGGYNLYNTMGIHNPIKEQLADIKEVEDVTIEKIDRKDVITIQLGQADNLKNIYQEITTILNNKYQPENYELIILDNRNNELDNVYDELHLAVYEAIANNQFLWLDEQLNENLTNFNYKLSVDEKRLYLQIQHDNYYVYEVLDRSTEVVNINKEV